MVDKIEDLNFPNTVVARLIKDALPEGISVAKEARSALARAASVFVIYLTSSATNIATSQNHKTMTGQNVLEALEEIEFENFIEPLKESLELYRKSIKEKKEKKKDETEKKEENNETDMKET